MRITMLSKFKAVLYYPGNNNITDNFKNTITTTEIIIKNALNSQKVKQLSHLINIIVIYMYLTINIKKKKVRFFVKENKFRFIKYFIACFKNI